MKITLDNVNLDYKVQSYDKGTVKINNRLIDYPVIVNRSGIYAWQIETLSELNTSHVQDIFQYKPEIFILGTGIAQIFPAADIVVLYKQSCI